MDVAQIVQKGNILNAQKVRPALRKVLGALIWLRQSRRDIGYDITKIATGAVSASADVEMALGTLIIYNRTVRFVKDYDREILYGSHGHQQESCGGRWGRLQMMRFWLRSKMMNLVR